MWPLNHSSSRGRAASSAAWGRVRVGVRARVGVEVRLGLGLGLGLELGLGLGLGVGVGLGLGARLHLGRLCELLLEEARVVALCVGQNRFVHHLGEALGEGHEGHGELDDTW